MSRVAIMADELQILGLKAAASWPEIQSAYRKKALELHPDLRRASGFTGDGAEFRRVSAAYERLRREHLEERMRTRDHLSRIASDPAVGGLSIEELELRIRHSSCPQLRAASLFALSDRCGREARTILLAAAHDEDAQVRRTAAEGLKKNGKRWDALHCVVLEGLRRLRREESR